MGPPGGSACRRPSDESAASARMSNRDSRIRNESGKNRATERRAGSFRTRFVRSRRGRCMPFGKPDFFGDVCRAGERRRTVSDSEPAGGGCAVCRSVFRVLYIRRTGRMAVVVSCFGSEVPPAAVVRDWPKASSACGKAEKTVRGECGGLSGPYANVPCRKTRRSGNVAVGRSETCRGIGMSIPRRHAAR